MDETFPTLDEYLEAFPTHFTRRAEPVSTPDPVMPTTEKNEPRPMEVVQKEIVVQREIEDLAGDTPSVARAVKLHGGAAAYAQKWVAAGFEARDVTNWLEGARCLDVDCAARLCVAGITSLEASQEFIVGGNTSRRMGFLASTGELSREEVVGLVEAARKISREQALRDRVLGKLTPIRLEPRRPLNHQPSEQIEAIQAVLERIRPEEVARKSLDQKKPVPVAERDWREEAAVWDYFGFRAEEVETWLTVARCPVAAVASDLDSHRITPQMAAHEVSAGKAGQFRRATVAAHLGSGVLIGPMGRSTIFEAAYGSQKPQIVQHIDALVKSITASERSNTEEIFNLIFNSDEAPDYERTKEIAGNWISYGFNADDFQRWAVQAECYHLESAKSLRDCRVTPQEAALTTTQGSPLEYSDQKPTLGYKLSVSALPLHKAVEVVYSARRQTELATAWTQARAEGVQVEEKNPYTLSSPDAEESIATTL